MKALRSHAPGGPETLTLDEVTDPVAGAGEVLVRVKAVGVNFPDTLIIQDLYQTKPPRPFSPGIEFSGVVEALGEGVTGFAPGDRVCATISHGAMAEKVTIATHRLFRLPAAIDFDIGATLLLTYGTTIHALKDRGHLKAGDTLLVLGAAGGVGLAAVEMGKAMGARVIAAVSSEDKAQAAREAGADDVVLYGRPPFDKDQSRALATAFKAACGPDGANVIYDAVGGDYTEPALRSIAWGGRYLVIGFTAGIPKLPLNLTLLKSCDVCGVFFGAMSERDPAHNARNTAELFAMAAAGKLRPRIGAIFPLERGGEAIALLAGRKVVGKALVRVGN